MVRVGQTVRLFYAAQIAPHKASVYHDGSLVYKRSSGDCVSGVRDYLLYYVRPGAIIVVSLVEIAAKT